MLGILLELGLELNRLTNEKQRMPNHIGIKPGHVQYLLGRHGWLLQGAGMPVLRHQLQQIVRLQYTRSLQEIERLQRRMKHTSEDLVHCLQGERAVSMHSSPIFCSAVILRPCLASMILDVSSQSTCFTSV